MAMVIDSELEAKLRQRADAAGISVEAYLERIVTGQAEEQEVEELALEGLHSGEPIQPGPGYWEEKHGRLEERFMMRNILR